MYGRVRVRWTRWCRWGASVWCVGAAASDRGIKRRSRGVRSNQTVATMGSSDDDDLRGSERACRCVGVPGDDVVVRSSGARAAVVVVDDRSSASGGVLVLVLVVPRVLPRRSSLSSCAHAAQSEKKGAVAMNCAELRFELRFELRATKRLVESCDASSLALAMASRSIRLVRYNLKD